MTRLNLIERIRRQIYNGQPSDDATITVNLVNAWLEDAIAFAAKANYKDNIALEGVGYVNNSFYSKFKDIEIKKDNDSLWTAQLPSIPPGIGTTEGLSSLELKDSNGRITRPFVPLSEKQKTVYQDMRIIPDKVLYYYEGSVLYAISTLNLDKYKANVTMISGGNSDDLDSELNIPPDYIPMIIEYIQKQLLLEKAQPLDTSNDGQDFITTV